MGAPASVDLLGTNCAPLNIESIVLFYPKLHACGVALSLSVVKLRTPAALASAPSISRQWSHCMGSTPWVHHAADHRTYLRPSVPSKVVKLQTIMQLMNLPAFAETSDASPSSPTPAPSPFLVFRARPMCCIAAQCMSVLQNWFATISFHLQLQKLYCGGIFGWCWTNERPNWPSINKF